MESALHLLLLVLVLVGFKFIKWFIYITYWHFVGEFVFRGHVSCVKLKVDDESEDNDSEDKDDLDEEVDSDFEGMENEDDIVEN